MAAAAIILAAVAGIGVYMYASNADQRAEESAGFVEALVATSDIAKGTTGSQALQAGLVKTAKVAKSSLPPSIVRDANELVDRIAAGRIDAKQFITERTFVSSDEGIGGTFASAIARENLVAVTVSVDAERGVANQIAPGDRVDIVTTANDDEGNAVTEFLLRNVKVLAVGASTVQQQTAASGGAAAAPLETSGLLTFEVLPEDALSVIGANSGSSKIYLVLLPPGPGAGSATAASASSR